MQLRSTFRWSSWLFATGGVICASASCDPTIIGVVAGPDGASNSLRAAIDRANRDPSITRIELTAGTYHLSLCDRDDTNASGDLDVHRSAPLAIAGVGGLAILDNDCGLERVLDSHGTGVLTLTDVQIYNGFQAEPDGQPGYGGGLRAAGDVTLERVQIMSNHVRGGNGKSDASGVIPPGAAYGAGLYVGGSLKLKDTLIHGNFAASGEAAADAAGALVSKGGSAHGGGAFVLGAVSVEGGFINDNFAVGTPGVKGGDAQGGGIAQAPSASQAVTVTGTSIQNNTARGGDSTSCDSAGQARGGSIAIFGPAVLRDVNSHSNGAIGGDETQCARPGTAVTGGARGGFVASAARVTVIGGTHRHNHAVAGFAANAAASGVAIGGAVYTSANLDVTDSTFEHNSASFTGAPSDQALARGGALAADGALTLRGGELSLNSAHNVPSVGAPPGTGAGRGAAIHAASASIDGAHLHDNPGVSNPVGVAAAVAVTGHLELSHSLLARNQSGAAAGSLASTAVSFIENTGAAISSPGSVHLQNTTLSGNQAGVTAGALNLEHATIVNNAGIPLNAARLSSFASVVVSSGAAVCTAKPKLGSATYSWFSDASCGLGGGNRETPGDTALKPLASGDGLVPTHVPALGSALVDAITASACRVPEDARGVRRPQGVRCDLGAAEVGRPAGAGPADLALVFASGPTAAPVNEASTWQLVVANRGPNASTPVVIVDTPTGARIASLSAPGATCWPEPSAALPARWSCGFDSAIAARGSATVTLVGTASPGATNVTWRARVTGDVTAPLTDDVAAITTPTTETPSVDLELTATREEAVQATGDTTDFELRVRNKGALLSSNVRVELSAGTPADTFAFSPSTGSVTTTPGDAQSPGKATWAIAALAPGQTAVLRGVALTDCAQFSYYGPVMLSVYTRPLSAKVTSTDNDVYPANDSLQLNTCTAQLGTSDLSINNLEVLPGATASERRILVTVHNAGPSPARTPGLSSSAWSVAPEVTLRLPAGVMLPYDPQQFATAFLWQPMPLPASELAVGATKTLEFSVRVDPAQVPAAPWIEASVFSYFTPDPRTDNDLKAYFFVP